jgi:hypothetical protein
MAADEKLFKSASTRMRRGAARRARKVLADNSGQFRGQHTEFTGLWNGYLYCPRNESESNVLTKEESTMVYRGIVKQGVVVLEEGAKLPEGTEVRVEPIPGGESPAGEGPTLVEQFGDVIGSVPDLPADMAENHDHYLHGAPKQ